jgi:acetylornithine deacetylase/succinyl-diaminopimelate desuccinylase-like protein
MHSILQAAHDAQDAYIDTLKQLVTIETPSRDREAAAGFIKQVQTLLEHDSWQVRTTS